MFLREWIFEFLSLNLKFFEYYDLIYLQNSFSVFDGSRLFFNV